MKKITKVILISTVLMAFSISAHAAGLMQPVNNTPFAEDFSLMGVDGRTYTLKDYKGKFALVNFWATWCPPCVKEMPSLNTLYEKLGDRMEVVGVHAGLNLAVVKEFLKEHPVNFDVIIDKKLDLNWGQAGLPTTFLLDPEGRIIYKATGERDWGGDEMVEFLKEVMDKHVILAQDSDEAKTESINYLRRDFQVPNSKKWLATSQPEQSGAFQL